MLRCITLFCYRMMLYQGFGALPFLLSKRGMEDTLDGAKKMLRLS
jgi:hypothetical protein